MAIGNGILFPFRLSNTTVERSVNPVVLTKRRSTGPFPEGGDVLVVCLAMTGAAVDVTLASAERRLRVSGSHCVLSKVKLGR